MVHIQYVHHQVMDDVNAVLNQMRAFTEVG